MGGKGGGGHGGGKEDRQRAKEAEGVGPGGRRTPGHLLNPPSAPGAAKPEWIWGRTLGRGYICVFLIEHI